VAYVAQNRLGAGLGDVIIVAVMVAIFANGLLQTMVASRLTWAISRDGLFPGSTFFHKLSRRTGTPANALLLAAVIEILFAVFFNHLSNLIAASALVPVGVYLVISIAYLFRRRRFPVQKDGFSLGRLDLPITIGSVLWSILLLVWLVVPSANHKSAVIAAGIFVSGIVWWAVLRLARPQRLRARGAPLIRDSSFGAPPSGPGPVSPHPAGSEPAES
jgi:amino acid transporter